MQTDTIHAPSLESPAALSGILALLVEVRAMIANDTAVASPAREQSVIDKARATLLARQASTS